MSKSSSYYKQQSIREFTRIAKSYETNHAGVYNLCKKDYPDILEELEKETFTDLLDSERYAAACSHKEAESGSVKMDKEKIGGVAETMLQTLYAKAKESDRPNHKIYDDKAIEIVEQMENL